MNIKVINATSESDIWEQEINKIPDELNDIYFNSKYAKMNNLSLDSNPILFSFYDNNFFWLYSFIMSPINKKFYPLQENCYFDIETPYGYGGPISNTDDETFLNHAQNEFFNWCHENNIVAEFVRFHPVINNFRFYQMLDSLEINRYTISSNLKELPAIRYDQKTRNMIRKFRKNNFNISITKCKDKFLKFVEIYKKNIISKNVSKFYLFNEKYFQQLYEIINKYGCIIFSEDNEENFLGGIVILNGKKISHYHLSATIKSSEYAGLTNALLDKALDFAKDSNLEYFHFGGGNSASKEDNLFKFKKKMGNVENKFYIGKKIHNLEIYNTIKENWSKLNNNKTIGDKTLFYKD